MTDRPRSPLTKTLTAFVIAAAVAITTPVMAQEPASSDEEVAKEAAKNPTAASEIVVTARKKEENIQEVPVAVTAVTGEALEEAAAGDISELQSSTPNLSIYAGRNQSTTLTVFLRGIGQADPLWGVDPGVGLYFDDVYIARPQGALLDVYDVERIEVLRGPQGTLYGKNTIGGAIKYVSRPLTDDFGGSISFTGGSYSNQDLRASIGGALIPGKLRAKLSVASLQHDGYGTNEFSGRDLSDKDTTAYRLAMDWLPSDTVTVQFSYDKTEDESQPKGLTLLAANPFCPLFLGAPCPATGEIFHNTAGINPPFNGTDSEGFSLRVSWDMSDAWAFKSITASRESDSENAIDFDTVAARITDVFATYYDEQVSQEFQFLYDAGGSFDGVFGLYYFDGEAGGLVKNIFINSIFGTTEGYTKTESFALFGEGNYAIDDKLTLNVGLRATREDKNVRALNRGFTNDTFTVPNAVTADFDKTETFDSISPKLGFSYQFNPDVMGYFSAGRGFKSGGFNVRAQATVFPRSAEPFDDEVLDVAELGLKTVLDEGRLVLNSAIFYGEYKDVQVSTFTAYDSNGDGVDDAFFGDFINAGDAEVKGAEVEFNWFSGALDWLGFSGHVSYLDAEPTSFLDANRDGFVDTQVITNAPELTASFRANLDFPAFGGLLTSSLGWSYRDDSVLTNEGGQYPGRPGQPLLPITQEAYSLVDAWISWLAPNGSWRVGVSGKNLTDEEYLTNGYNIPALGILVGSYGAPRTVLGTIEYRF